jgi:hypothetical protein
MTAARPPLDETFARPAAPEQVDRTAAGLEARGFAVHVVENADAARKIVLDLLPTDRSIFTAASETLRLSGLAAAIDESPDYVSVRRQLAGKELSVPEQIRMGATPEVVVGSVHAITEDGVMLAASGSGSQLGAYAATAPTAIWVVGAQKLVADLDTALRRIRTHSLPLEWDRVQRVYGKPSTIGKILILERELIPGRGTVVLVRTAIGF